MNQQDLPELIDYYVAEKWSKLDLSNQELTNLPSEVSRLTGLTSLDLSGNKLTTIPSEIGQLTNLTSLNLSNNQLETVPSGIMRLTGLIELSLSTNRLTNIPPEIGQLTSLTELYLDTNRLTDMPPEIGQLTSLTTFSLSRNQLTSVPSNIGQMGNLTVLGLSRNKLTAVPPEIGQLKNLEKLYLDGNQLTSLPKGICQLANLIKLDARSNQLESLPLQISKLRSLVILDLRHNKLTSLPDKICELENLEILNLGKMKNSAERNRTRGNKISKLPAQIKNLNNLTKLDLSGNKFTDIPPQLNEMINLTDLDMSDNQLTNLPTQIGNLTNLIKLDLWRNKLTAVPKEICQLNNLIELRLGENRLTDIPEEIDKLKNLLELHLGINKLEKIPSEIGQLTKLTKLFLKENQLVTVPSEIGTLENLTNLDLQGNNLENIPSEIGQLENLSVLVLDRNQLKGIPSEIGQLANLTKLYLQENKLTQLPVTLQQMTQLETLALRYNLALGIPQEVLEQTDNPSLILKIYFGNSRPLHEAKMLLVGQGGVGKTALARRLRHNLPPDESQGKTPAVDIHKWQVTPRPKVAAPQHPNSPAPTPITLNLWDFGGQGVYQATHQFFFTSRSLYLVVVNARTGEQESRLNHWLKLVASLSDNAPVIIVVNKQDEHTLQLDERELKHKYPNLLDVIATSCTTGQGITQLREAIAAALAQLPDIYDRFPTDWLSLKAQLEKMDSNYITYERYADYCREAGIHDPADQRSWVNVLHQLGVVLNYQDENYRHLEGTHVLKPDWVTDGVYRILSDPDQRITNNAGILTMSMLDDILNPDNYPRYQQTFIVGMMQKFELCFRLPNGQNQYLIPDLLPKEQPEEAVFFQKARFLEFEIHYTDFLPDSILSRFMVGMMDFLDRRASWRNGAVLQFGDNRALVRADSEARKLFITVTGAEATRRSLLNSIRMQLHAIHNTFPNLPLTEQVPIPDHPGKTIDYEELLWYESEGELNPSYAPIRGKIDVKALLDGIETPALRRERQLQEQLMQAYNLDELAQLCFDLAVDIEDLPGTTKSAKTRELVQYMERHNRLDALEAALRR